MEQFKRVKVVMLPTNEKSKLVLSFKEKSFNQLTESKLALIKEANYQLSNIQSQHLYIISDDEIKEGDWIFANQGVHKVTDIKDDKYPYGTLNHKGDKIYHHNSWKKIIATTDTSLNDGIQKGKIYNPSFKGTKYEPIIIPQPSQQFIKKYIESYNKGNIITDVLVEYEKATYDKWFDNGGQPVFDTLKINPKDNTITIKKLKDSWNREEVIELIKRFNSESAGNVWFDTDEEWIEENL